MGLGAYGDWLVLATGRLVFCSWEAKPGLKNIGATVFAVWCAGGSPWHCCFSIGSIDTTEIRKRDLAGTAVRFSYFYPLYLGHLTAAGGFLIYAWPGIQPW